MFRDNRWTSHSITRSFLGARARPVGALVGGGLGTLIGTRLALWLAGGVSNAGGSIRYAGDSIGADAETGNW